MKCPNCQKNFTKGSKCPHCMVDTILYMGIVRLSDKLYNKALERLNASDFSHGIELLTKSITINKNHVPARNLLGLALFEVGHVGEALKHWIISQGLLSEENPAAKYIESVNKSSRQLEKLNDAVGMYNQALGHIKQKSDDLAIIQLKKAIDINPRFVDALNLLTLCYLIQSDKDRALTMADRALAVDAFNPVTLNYYAAISPGRKPFRNTAPKPNLRNAPPQTKGLYKSIGLEEKKQTNFHIAEILTFIIGVICAGAVFFFMLMPAMDDRHERELSRAQQELIDAELAYASLQQQHENDLDNLQLEMAGLVEARVLVEADLEAQQRVNHVNQAYWFFLDDDLRRAVDMLDDFDRHGLPHDVLERLETVLESSYPRLGLSYYNSGLDAFRANDFHMALVYLDDAHRFLDEEATQWNRLLFMLGRVHYLDGRHDTAYDFLTQLRDRAAPNFPNFTGTERTAIGNMISAVEAGR